MRAALPALGLEAASRGALVPVLSLIVLRKGMTLSELSAVFAVFSATAFLLEVPSGMAADWLGRKRVFLLAQAAGMAALCLLAGGEGFRTVCAAFFLYGASRALSSGSMEALYMDACMEEGRLTVERAATRLELCGILGCAAGALAGGGLNFAGEGISETAGSRLVLYTALCLLAASLCLCLFVPEGKYGDYRETGEKDRRGRKRGLPALFRRELGKSIVLPVMLGSSLFAGFAAALLETFWQPRFLSLLPKGYSWLLGILGFFYFIASAGGSLLAGRVLREENLPSVFLTAGTAAGCALLCLSQIRGGGLFFLFYLFLYFALGSFATAQSTAVHRAAPPQFRATLLSGEGFALQIGGFLAGCFANAAAERLGISGLWLSGGAVILAGTWTAFLLQKGAPVLQWRKSREGSAGRRERRKR